MSFEVIEEGEERLELTNTDINLRNFDIKPITLYPETEFEPLGQSNLLSASNSLGYLVTGVNNQFYIAKSKRVRQACRQPTEPDSSFLNYAIPVPLENPDENLFLLTLSSCQKNVLAVTDRHLIHIYDAIALLSQATTQPHTTWDLSSAQLGGTVTSLLPHPTNPELTLVLFQNGLLLLLKEGEPTWKRENVTSVCWSPTGKRLAVGLKDGQILICSLNNTTKSTFPVPDSLKSHESCSVPFLIWPEPQTLLPIYWIPTDDAPLAYLYSASFTRQSLQFNRLYDFFLFDPYELDQVRFYSTLLSDFTPEFTQVVVLCSNILTEPNIIIKGPDQDWCTTAIDDLNRISMPCRKGTDGYPIGLALDLTASGSVYNLLPDLDPMPSVPVLYVMTTFGELQTYDCISRKLAIAGEESRAMTQARQRGTPQSVPGSSDPEKEPTSDPISDQPEEEEPDSVPTTPEVIDLLRHHLVHPLLNSDNFDGLTLSDLQEEARQSPLWDSSDHSTKSEDPVELIEPPNFVYEPPTDTGGENSDFYVALRRFDNDIYKMAILIGFFQSRWQSSLVLDGEVSSVQNEIHSLSTLIDESSSDCLSLHEQGLVMLDKLQYVYTWVQEDHHRLTGLLPSSSDSYRESDPGFQAVMTSTLVNLTAHLHTCQNLLNILPRHFFATTPSARDLVLTSPTASHYLHLLTQLPATLHAALHRLDFLRSCHPPLDPIFQYDSAPLPSAFAAVAPHPIPPTAPCHTDHHQATAHWLDQFHHTYTQLPPAPTH